MKLSCFAATLALALGVLTHAHAAPLVLGDKVTVENQSGSVFTPSASGDGLFSNVQYRLENQTTVNASAGLFVLDHRPDGSATGVSWTEFLSFCLEPDVLLTPFDNPYQVKSVQSVSNNAVSLLISELWGRYIGLVTNDNNAAAFQVALWELAFDDGGKNLEQGDFKLLSGGTVKATAQTWLDSLDGKGPQADGLVVLVDNTSGRNNPNRQNLLTQARTNDVPEPGMLTLLGTALAGMAAMRRRQRPGA